jgi:hypothetical protein
MTPFARNCSPEIFERGNRDPAFPQKAVAGSIFGGGNIGDVVDTDRVINELKSEVAFVRKERYLCSKPSVDTIKDSVEKQNLDRIKMYLQQKIKGSF